MSLIATILWTGGELPLMEICRFSEEGRGFRFTGTVVGELEGEPLEVRYRIDCSSNWHTRRVEIELQGREGLRKTLVQVDRTGRWMRDGTELPEFSGLVDIDLGITPSTNTLPVRRLNVIVGSRFEIRAVWVKFPSLEIVELRQTYTRTAERHYLYESSDGSFRAELELDELGIVQSYGKYWKAVRRIAEKRAGVQPRLRGGK